LDEEFKQNYTFKPKINGEIEEFQFLQETSAEERREAWMISVENSKFLLFIYSIIF